MWNFGTLRVVRFICIVSYSVDYFVHDEIVCYRNPSFTFKDWLYYRRPRCDLRPYAANVTQARSEPQTKKNCFRDLEANFAIFDMILAFSQRFEKMKI